MAALRDGDREAARLDPKQHALLELVELLTRHAHRCTDQDVQRLRDVGWTEPQIAEAVYITALFAFFTRVADAFGLADPHYEQMANFSPPGSWRPQTQMPDS